MGKRCRVYRAGAQQLPFADGALDLVTASKLTFAKPDMDTFRCLAMAIHSAKTGGTAPAILNGANEIAVARFLAGEIGFLDIADLVEGALNTVPVKPLTLEAVFEADSRRRRSSDTTASAVTAARKRMMRTLRFFMRRAVSI